MHVGFMTQICSPNATDCFNQAYLTVFKKYLFGINVTQPHVKGLIEPHVFSNMPSTAKASLAFELAVFADVRT